MQTTRAHNGGYNVTGTMAGITVLYVVSKESGGHWSITRAYGSGPTFEGKNDTKREAVQRLLAYAD